MRTSRLTIFMCDNNIPLAALWAKVFVAFLGESDVKQRETTELWKRRLTYRYEFTE